MNFAVAMSVLLGFSAVCYMLLAVRLFSGQREIGSVPLGATFIVVAVWVFAGAVEFTATSLAVFNIGRVGHFVGTALVPVTILACFREFTGAKTSGTMIAALLIIPVLSIIAAATNYWHEFMWYLAVSDTGQFLAQPVAWGPWFMFVHAPYGYAVIGVSILTLVLHISAVAPAHRRALLLLASSSIPPILAVAAYDLGIGPKTFSLPPLAFGLMLPIYAWLIFGERIIEFTPLAYETVFQNMQDPVVVVDDQRRIIGLNHGAEALLDISETEALRQTIDKLFGEDAEEVYAALDTGSPQKMMTNSGRFLHLQVTPIAPNQAMSRTGRVLMFRDVSDVEKAQREIENSERLLRTLVDHSVNGIIRMRWIEEVGRPDHRELRCIFANSAAGRYLQTDPEKMINCTAAEIITLASSGMEIHDTNALLQRFLDAAEVGELVDTETRITAGRSTQWLRVIAEPVGDDVAVTFVDVTDRKAKEIQMESIAWSDPLTGVLNRRGFERDAAKLLLESPDDATGALLFIDLNEFKSINDQCGHEVGDQLLTIAAERLRTSLRSRDIIGRPGGDEFVALVPDVHPDVAEKLAERLTESLERPYTIGTEELTCAASIGLALYPKNANTLTGLLRAADQAMYRAKARTRGVDDISGTDLLEKAG